MRLGPQVPAAALPARRRKLKMTIYKWLHAMVKWNLDQPLESAMIHKMPKPPTHTHLVYEALLHAEEDFLTVRQLMTLTGSQYNQVNAALFLLRKYRAVDVVVEADGTGWWFATPDTDQRTRTVDERTPEEKPRKPRAARIVALPVRPRDDDA